VAIGSKALPIIFVEIAVEMKTTSSSHATEAATRHVKITGTFLPPRLSSTFVQS
jgi:hypothetical protein